MRATIGIAIALPVAAVFCLAYLTMLALEAWRDGTRSREAARSSAVESQAWTGPARMAA
jgi:threonine/homoserine/homoserine lactone efflux protein